MQKDNDEFITSFYDCRVKVLNMAHSNINDYKNKKYYFKILKSPISMQIC